MVLIRACVLAALLPSAVSATHVWLDVDPAAGLFERDVDDAVAMIQAFNSPELTIHGISVVYGNAPLREGVEIAREMVSRFGPEGLAVHVGAASADELGTETDAVRAMAAALEERPLTVLAVGPLTNVGSLLMLHPELHNRIDALVIVAGRRPGQKFTYENAPGAAFPDFNFENDPAAMGVLLDSPVKLVLAPWEVSSHVWLTHDDLATLNATGGAGAWIAERAQSWIAMWERRFGLQGFNPFDTLAVGWVTHPHLIESFGGVAWITDGPNDRTGSNEPARKPYLLVSEDGDGRAVTYCYRPKPAFKDVLMNALTQTSLARGNEQGTR